MTIILRPHQIAGMNAVLNEWYKGVLSTLKMMATGTGKTETAFGTLAEEYANRQTKDILWISHREELVTEPKERVAKNWSSYLPAVGICMANRDDIGHTPFISSSIQTLHHAKRLDRVISKLDISHIVYDECHHIVAKKNMWVMEELRKAFPKAKLVGMTATPRRRDDDGLIRILKSTAYRYPLNTAIKDGVLVPFTAFTVELQNTDFGDLKKRMSGDSDEKEYVASEAVKIMLATNAHELGFQAWQQVASERSTIIFTYDVAYAYFMSQYWRDCGYTAVAVDANTPKDQREQIKHDFRSGKIQVVANCGVYTEGFDAAVTSCVIVARAVGSDSLYLQMVGRGLRPFVNKKDCVIMDWLPANARDVRMAGDLLGKPKEQRKAEEIAKKKGVISQAFGINRMGEGIDGDPDTVVMRVLDYLSNSSNLAWLYAGDIATVGISDNASLAIVFPQEGRYEQAKRLCAETGKEWTDRLESLYRRLNDEFQTYVVRGGDVKLLGTGATWEDVSYLAEDYAAENQTLKLSKRDEKWRRQPVSDKQLSFLKTLGVDPGEDMTKGDAAQAITHKKTISVLKEKRVIG